MEFTEDQLRLIRAMCLSTLGHIVDPKDFYEPWKSTFEVATAKLEELGFEV